MNRYNLILLNILKLYINISFVYRLGFWAQANSEILFDAIKNQQGNIRFSDWSYAGGKVLQSENDSYIRH